MPALARHPFPREAILRAARRSDWPMSRTTAVGRCRPPKHQTFRESYAPLAPARRRPHPVRRVPALLQAARGAARSVLRARARQTASCSTPTAARAASASIRSRRSRSIIFCRARPCSRSAPPGCNLACKFCQNWDISKSREMDTLARRAAPGGDRARPRRTARLPRAWPSRTTIPSIFLEYAIDVGRGLPRARASRPSRSRPATSATSPRAEFFRHMDAANVDLKAFTEDFYREVCAARARAGARDARVPRARDRRVVRDHDAAHPRRERLRRGDRRDDAAGSSSSSARTCRCTSPPSIPT